MRNTDCCVVQDLIPLALDDLLSEDSKRLVQAHISTCKKCRTYREEIEEERCEMQKTEASRDGRLKRAFKRRKYEMVGMIGGIVTLVVVILLCLFQPFSGKQEEVYSVKEHYETPQDYGKQKYKGIAGLALFPDEDVVSGQVEDFYYDCKGSKMYQTYQIYLECSYTATEFLQEKERLFSVTDEKTGRSVQYSEEENDLPCVYAMLYDEGFEYALMSEEEKKVIYIYLQGTDIRDLHFDRKYLTKDYGQAGYAFETEREAFRIYPTDQEEFYNEN